MNHRLSLPMASWRIVCAGLLLAGSMSGELVAITPLVSAQEVATEPHRVGGRTLAQWREQLASPSEVVRLRAIKSVSAFSREGIAVLIEALSDPSEAVRYWAASALGDLRLSAQRSGDTEHNDLEAQIVAARDALHQRFESSSSEAERLALAYGLVQTIVHQDEEGPWQAVRSAAFDQLMQRLRARERSMVMSAADFLGRLGRAGSPAMEELETIYYEHHVDENPIRKPNADYHLSGACLNALRAIDPAWKPTRFAP